MIGIHLQEPIDGWLEAIATSAAGSWHKVFAVEQATEIKARRADLKTILRHHVDNQDAYLNAADKRQAARDFLNTFVDGTFRQHARNVDAIEELNEYNATSHIGAELQKRVDWANAVQDIWQAEYKTQAGLGHIRLCVGNVAIGNDIPVEVARKAAALDNYLSYHAYWPTQNGQVVEMAHDEWFSLRWRLMDDQYRAAGVNISNLRWLFTEVGPVGYHRYTDGQGVERLALHADEGWRTPTVCNGNFFKLIATTEYWLSHVAEWNRTHGGRALGAQLFTSGRNIGWEHYLLDSGQLTSLFTHFAAWVPALPPPPVPVPVPVPVPAPPAAGHWETVVAQYFEATDSSGWYDVGSQQVPVNWKLWNAEGHNALGNPNGDEPWNDWRTAENRFMWGAFLPPEEHALFLNERGHTYKIFKGSGAFHCWLGLPALLEAGRYRLTLEYYNDSYTDIVDGVKMPPPDPLSFEAMSGIGDNRTPWMPAAFQANNRLQMEADSVAGEEPWIQFRAPWAIANNGAFVKSVVVEKWTGQSEPPAPPPGQGRGAPRTQYDRIYWRIDERATLGQYLQVCERAFALRRTVGFSVDDAMVGDLDRRTMVEFGDQYGQPALQEFRDNYYPGVGLEFEPLPEAGGITPAVEIYDIVAELPRHATERYDTRSVADISHLVIHHSVSPPDRPTESIAAYHVNTRGWPGIGYHFMVKADGRIEQTNYLETVSYHCGGQNGYSVGICLQGDFTASPPPNAQQNAARALVGHLRGILGEVTVLPHRGMPGQQTACPGATWEAWLGNVTG